MTGRYAKGTEVSAEKSRSEIEATLRRYGADQFIYGWQEGSAVIGFRAKGRQIKFVLTMPKQTERRFTHSSRGMRSPEVAQAAWEQACRQSWRALALVIKAKLEAVEAGITCFEDEFLAHIILPNGQPVGQWLRPQIAIAYERGDMPPLLPAPSGG
jgi:hypothetical protein